VRPSRRHADFRVRDSVGDLADGVCLRKSGIGSHEAVQVRDSIGTPRRAAPGGDQADTVPSSRWPWGGARVADGRGPA
jgi:hypothetical protein